MRNVHPDTWFSAEQEIIERRDSEVGTPLTGLSAERENVGGGDIMRNVHLHPE